MRPLLTAVGVLAAGALLWFIGPLVAVAGVVPLAGEPARWMAIVAVVAAMTSHTAWRSMQSARRNRRLLEGMVAKDEAAASAPGAKEVEVITQRFEQAVALLRQARIGGKRPWLAALAGRPYVYELPWYIIIGAPGAGKTTALINSGLQFPLANTVGEKVIRGIGGTRNCDWWFASEAVLIDTAGRYTTHDSDLAADRAAWFGFLKLLARYRPRRPINGVLLTISVSDLLGASPERRQAHAGALRERIEELHNQLGIAFPVYVLITKTDLLAGFMEFFADFDKDERSQVWGVTFPYQDDSTRDGPVVRMASDFAALEKRLNDCLMDRLQGEHDRERRGAAYTFPQQWHLLRQTLFDFLQTMFADLRPELRPLLRGVYFTSATQEGTPMDRALGGLARALGLTSRIVPPARPSGKTFFVTRLLRDVVFAEAGLAGTNLRWRRRRAVLAWGAVGATVCTVAAAVALSWRAYDVNRTMLTASAQRLPTLGRHVSAARSTSSTDLVALLPVLDMLSDFGRPSGAHSKPLALDMGLDRADMLVAASHDSYERALREAFLPRVAARLEERLRAGEREHVELIYETLKTYLMLFGGKNFDAAALRSHLSADWDATLPASVRPEQRVALRRHLDSLLASGEVGAPSHADPQLIATARSLVGSVPLAQRAYHRLKQMDLGAASFTVESAGGPAAGRVFVRASGKPLSSGVPALYSRTVWRQSLRERTNDVLQQFAREQSWVLGTAPIANAAEPAQQALSDEVQQSYLADYATQWSEFIGDLRLAPTADLTSSAELAQLLARPDSPLIAVLRASIREVSLSTPQVSASGTSAQGSDATIDNRFDALQRFLVGQPAALDDIRALLGKLAAQLAVIEDAVKRKTLPPVSDVVPELQAAAQRAPEPVRSMLLQLAAASGAQIFAVVREPLNAKMSSEFVPACSRVTAGRYPLSRNARDEMSREDFARTFGAGGLVDGFFRRNLVAYVDTSAQPWAYRKPGASGRGESPESLLQFQRAQAIREAFFRDGGRQFGTRLEFRLLELDTAAGEFTLDVDGQVLRFRPGAKAPQSLQWPGPGESGRVHLQLAPAGGGAGPGHVFEGPWALFHLLDRVRVEPGASPDRAQLVFDVEGHKARFEVKSASPLNPVLRRDLEQFQCPTRF